MLICNERSCQAVPTAIKPEHIGDAVRPGSDGTECVPLPRRHVISARPLFNVSARSIIVVHVGKQHMAQMAFAEHHDMIEAFPADRADLRMRFARVNAETSGGLECRLIERGG
jgi:hypothetical protein